MENTIEGEARDNDISQGADPRNMSITSEEETQGNTKDPNLIRSGCDRKTSSSYEPSFERK